MAHKSHDTKSTMARVPLHKFMIQVEERGPDQRLKDLPQKTTLISTVSLVRSTYSDRKAEDVKPWHLSFDKLLHQLEIKFGYRLNLESDELGYLGLESSENNLRNWQSIENRYGLETAVKELSQCPEIGKEASIHLYVFHPARNKPRAEDDQEPSLAQVQQPTAAPGRSFSASPSAPSSTQPDKSSFSVNTKTTTTSNLITKSQNPKVSSQSSSFSAENRRKAQPTIITGGLTLPILEGEKQQAQSPGIGKSTSKKKQPQEDVADEMEPPKSRKRKFTVNKISAPYKRMTLKDFALFKKSNDGKSVEIYNCSSGTYTPWDPENDVATANRLIWDAAREILRVQYFITHQCTVDDLQPWIPDEYLYQVWTPSEWKQKISWSQSLYGGNTVLQTIGYKILPEWKKKADYPIRRAAKSRAEKGEAKLRRIAFFDTLAHSDSDALDTFMAPFNPSLDWDTIRRRRTDTDKRIFEWAVRSLASGANILWKLGIEEKPLPGQRGKPEESRKRTQKWLAVSTNGEPPPFNTIPLASLFWGASSLEEDDEENIGNQSDAIEEEAEQPRKKRKAAPSLEILRSSDIGPQPKPVTKSAAKSPTITKTTSQPFRINGKFARKTETSNRAISEESRGSGVAGTTSNARKKNDKPLIINESTSALSTPLSLAPVDSSPSPRAQINSAVVYAVEKTPKFTTSKVMKWTDRDVCKFLEDVMMISPIDVRTFASYYNGRLNGKLLLSLKCTDICGKIDMELQSKQSRMWLCKVILQLQKRIQRNDQALRAREKEATEPNFLDSTSVDTGTPQLADPDKTCPWGTEKNTESNFNHYDLGRRFEY